MSIFKIHKKIDFIKKLELNIIKTKSSIEEVHQGFLKPYNKKKALELDTLSHRLCVYLKALEKVRNL